MKELLFEFMSKISGQTYNPTWEDKIFSIMTAIFFVIIFLLVFAILFYKYAWHDYDMRRDGIIVVIILSIFIIGKFILFRSWSGYIPDRLLFFSLPSPKIQNPVWFILAVGVFLLFIAWREKLQNLNAKKFLLALCLIFFVFSSLVSGIREGTKSIMDPMTRTYWEYTGNIPLIVNTHDFLRDYIILIPKFAAHATTHPPGYSLLVYYFSKLSGGSFLGISLLIILTAGMAIFPLYFLLKNFFEERNVRNILQLYIFVPSIVLMSGASLEAFFVLIVWLTITLLYIGWRKSWFFSALGGFGAGIALFSNFLFLILAPVFFGMFIYILLKNDTHRRAWSVFNLAVSFLSFVLFFVFLWQWAGYSIIENFIVARGFNQEAVISNWQSIGVYLTFLIMNVLSFGFALGVINLLIIFKDKYNFFIKNKPELWLGFSYILFLLLIGVFQGEVERLWMFVVPFFLFPLGASLTKISEKKFSLILSLLFLQIIFIQVLFYTYW